MATKRSKKHQHAPILQFQATTGFTVEQLDKLYDEYKKHSTAGKGGHQGVTREQMGFILKDMGIEPHLAHPVFDAFDTNKDGEIDLRELIQGLATILNRTTMEKLEFAFKVYDTNHDGTISRDEMYNMIAASRGLSVDDYDAEVNSALDEVMKAMDKNHDGAITFKEFHDAIESNHQLVDKLGKWLRSIPQISEPQRDRLVHVFKLIDKNQDGLIDEHELFRVGAHFNPDYTHEKSEELLRKMDRNKDHVVDLPEFLHYFATLAEKMDDEHFERAVKQFEHGVEAN